MAFEDLLLPNAVIRVGDFIPHSISANLVYPLVVEDTDGSVMDLSTGYTAEMVLNLSDGTNVLTWTESLVDGRVIDLDPDVNASLVVRATPAGLAALEAWVGRALVFTLVVTRTSDGVSVDLMRDCYLIPRPDND